MTSADAAQNTAPATATADPIYQAHRRPHVAYLTSQYPAPSHTFIRREVASLRELGWSIDTFSVRPGSSAGAGGFEPDQADKTFVIMEQRTWEFVFAHLSWSVRRPSRYLRALALALAHRPPGLKALALAVAHFVEAGLLARELERRDIKHLHNHFANSGATVGMIAAKLAGIPWSFTMHGVSETDYPAGLLLGRKIEAASWVACASWFMRAQGMRAVGPQDWHKLHVVRCGVVPADLPVKTQNPTDLTSIICVGRLSPEKGHAGLFTAFAEVAKARPGLHLRLIGDGPYRELLENLASELGIADRVRFVGALTESATVAEIAQSDLLVLPSFLEGLPVVLIEAMGIGVPVVAPRLAGIPELVDHGTTGLLFTPSDWQELGERISQLASDPKLYSSIVSRGREIVAAQFDVRFAAVRLSHLFGLSDANPSAAAAGRPGRASFGLTEAILFSLIALTIAVAVALSNGISSPRPQPLPRGAAASNR